MTRLSDEFRQSLATMAAAYGLELIAGASSEAEAARSYLAGRGLSTQDCSRHGIGMVTDQFDEHAWAAGMLCFPYITTLGGVVSLKFRQAHDCTEAHGHQKFYTPYETRLYNTRAFDLADKLGYVCICEGEIDTLTLAELTGMPPGIPAVGIPGVDTWAKHPEWKELFRGYKHVFVFEDQDPVNPKTGEKPGEKLSKQILKDIDTSVLVKLPGRDVNDTYRRFGPKVIRERINV